MNFKTANSSELFILLCGKNKKLPDLHNNLIDLNAETANSSERGYISELVKEDLSRQVGKPAMWFRNRSDTNQAVHSQKRAISMKFWI